MRIKMEGLKFSCISLGQDVLPGHFVLHQSRSTLLTTLMAVTRSYDQYVDAVTENRLRTEAIIIATI